MKVVANEMQHLKWYPAFIFCIFLFSLLEIMRSIISFIIVFGLTTLELSAQTVVKQKKDSLAQKKIMSPTDFGVIENIGNIPKDVVVLRKKYALVPNKMRRNPYVAQPESESQEVDRVKQTRTTRSLVVNPSESWNGISEASQQVAPPDPSGAAGPLHYVQMVNTAMQIFDKSGNSLWGPTSLSAVFPGSSNDGDPIVLYDKFADRWFISQFQSLNNKILIAISKTNNPLGNWYYYEYRFDEFPDYPKYSIWGCGYIMTSNTTVQNAVAFNREKMLLGDPSAEVVALTIPNLNTDNFISVLPATAEGNILPSKDEPVPMFYFNDNGWGSGNDVIRIWEMSVDWTYPNASKIELTQEIPVAPFNTDFDQNWDDISQPGTSQKLDAVPGAFMYMAHHRTFTGYESVALCQTVDVDLSSNIQSGIRWYELRKSSDTWALHQQSTYAPDNTNRFIGSIAMDRQGNIGLAYSQSSSSVFPSLAFTGRKKTDPIGQMTVDERVVFNGTGSQTSTNRFGDYSHMTVDPSDELTFWYTGEYISNSGWETGVFSFKIGDSYNSDVTVVDVLEPQNGGTSGLQFPKVLIKNLGNSVANNVKVVLETNLQSINQTFNLNLASNDTVSVQFNSSINLVPGENFLKVHTELLGDEDLSNDTLIKSIFIKYERDAGAQAILSPNTAYGLTNEQVSVRIKNYGFVAIDSVPIQLIVNGNVVNTDTIFDTILPDSSYLYTFQNTVDLSTVGLYDFVVFTDLSNDLYSLNDTAKLEVENLNCHPQSDCSFTDLIKVFNLYTIQNNSGCSPNGYADFTYLSTDLARGDSYSVYVETEELDHYFSMWIDFNDNLVFESDELLMADSTYDIQGTFTLTIPNDAPVGNHLMRIRTHWDGSSADPCLSYDYGETEDYTVNIVIPDFTKKIELPNFYVHAEGGNLVVHFDQALKLKSTIYIVNGLGQTLKKADLSIGTTQNVILVDDLPKGIYYVKIVNEKSNATHPFVVR